MIFADFISDHGECIEGAIDRVDSERVAELVRQRLDTLNEKELGAIMAVYGDCFLNEKKTVAQYAQEIGVSGSAVSYWLQKARWKILNNRKPLYQYMRDDEYYRPLLKKTSKERTALELKYKKKPRKHKNTPTENLKQSGKPLKAEDSAPSKKPLPPPPPGLSIRELYDWVVMMRKRQAQYERRKEREKQARLKQKKNGKG
jgi:predicted transcriptional regulator